MAQLSLLFYCTHREVVLWIIWGSLCNAFYFLFFLVFLFSFMLRANLLAHRCKCFREGMRQKRTALSVDPGVFLIRLRMRNHCWVTSISQYKKTGKKATIPGFHCTAIQDGLSACVAFKCSSQAEIGRVEGSIEYYKTNYPGGDYNIKLGNGFVLKS